MKQFPTLYSEPCGFAVAAASAPYSNLNRTRRANLEGKQQPAYPSHTLNMHRMRGCNLFSITCQRGAFACKTFPLSAMVPRVGLVRIHWSARLEQTLFSASTEANWAGEKMVRPIEIKEGAVPPLPTHRQARNWIAFIDSPTAACLLCQKIRAFYGFH